MPYLTIIVNRFGFMAGMNLWITAKTLDCVMIPPIHSNYQDVTLDKKTRDGMKVSEQDSCGPPAPDSWWDAKTKASQNQLLPW